MIQNYIFIFFALYTVMLFVIMWITSRKADNDTYFTGNRKSPWFVVAYGMIGASLSGVTFMSVPGDVLKTDFTYYGVVLGYLIGYLVIAYVLLPIYYKANLTSIYQLLGDRFGKEAQKTGSILFIVSRLLGSALRMYLVIFVLQFLVFDSWGIPIWLTAIFIVAIIYTYTAKGGVKTVVWTDLLQTTFFLAALIFTIIAIMKNIDFTLVESIQMMNDQGILRVFNTNWQEGNYFLKQIIGGMFIAISMTGLDQDMMQKNLSCKNLKSAQRNVMSFSIILLFVNLFFLFLGGLLIIFAQENGLDLSGMKTDQIYPYIASEYLGISVAILFVIGLIAAGYSSADGTFAALTTSFCVDILGIKNKNYSEKEQYKIRRWTHAMMSVLFLLVIVFFSSFHNDALITIIFKVAGYTYGPILGLFVFGIFTQRKMKNNWLIPIFSLLTPTIIYIIAANSAKWLNNYQFGFELIIVNGLLMLGLLWAGSTPENRKLEKKVS